MFRSVWLLTILAALAFTQAAQFGNGLEKAGRDLVLGQRLPGDRQLHVETVRRPGQFLQIQKWDVEYPPGGPIPSSPTITAIEVRDLDPNADNGKVTIQNGGVGQKQVSVRFRSSRGKGLAWNLYIYGR